MVDTYAYIKTALDQLRTASIRRRNDLSQKQQQIIQLKKHRDDQAKQRAREVRELELRIARTAQSQNDAVTYKNLTAELADTKVRQSKDVKQAEQEISRAIDEQNTIERDIKDLAAKANDIESRLAHPPAV